MEHIRIVGLSLLKASLAIIFFLLPMAAAYSASQQYTYYYDMDKDGWGTFQSMVTGSPIAPNGTYTALLFGDHNDYNVTVHPGANEPLGFPVDVNGDAIVGTPLGSNAPQFIGIFPGFAVQAGNTLQFSLFATDSDDPNLTNSFQMQANPSGAILTNSGQFTFATTAADVGTYQLRFFVYNPSGFSQLDTNVTVTAAIPEPETYAMMLAGLGLLGLFAREKGKSNFPI